MRTMMLVLAMAALSPAAAAAEAILPVGNAPESLPCTHFPDRAHAVVWRNWELIDVARIAEVLGTTPDDIRRMADAMGLPPHVPLTEAQRKRSYISVIRRNWHLLNYEQLLALLGWDAEHLAYTLKEDDFLWHKLGSHKPKCSPVRYTPPDEAVAQRCAHIKAIVAAQFGDVLTEPAEPRFAFVDALAAATDRKPVVPTPQANDGIRFLYSYFAVYGDPLMHPELDPYPDGLLQRLSALGVNGVWLHVVLHQLAPSERFPEFGAGHETRRATLRQLVQQAKKHGIRVYLYMNEPRAMPASFFEQRPHMKGAGEQGHFAMCTSVPEVRQWLTESLTSVFADVPDLGGVFTITASENLTNCPSHGGQQQCPRCKDRPIPEIIAEVNTAIEAGVHRGNPEARVLVWDWAWRNEWAEPIIRALPDRVSLMSVSEWDLPIQRGGVSTAVGEYSISSVGPGPRAQAHWALARQCGLSTMAKVQVNCTWELSAVPYLPAMDLVAQHMANLAQAGVDGLMLSWTLGGYPSPNLQLASLFFGDSPPATADEALARLAVDRYGPTAAGHARRAWTAFSAGFAEFPYHGSTVYNAPMQYGPMNLLHPAPTGFRATMVGFPYDDLDRWRSVYPADVFGRQFEKVADGWRKGLDGFRHALAEATEPAHRANLTEDLRVAEAAWVHFASVANQIRFTLARNALTAAVLPADQRATHRATMKAACEDEIELAKRLFRLTRQDSRIGFEASNHYYYLPLDLVEKVIDCTDILERRLPD